MALVHSDYTVMKGKRRLNAGVNTTVAVRTDDESLFPASQDTKHRYFVEKLTGMLSFGSGSHHKLLQWLLRLIVRIATTRCASPPSAVVYWLWYWKFTRAFDEAS